MRKKILILGSGGMLGHVVNLTFRSFPDLFEVTDVSRKKSETQLQPNFLLDVTNFSALESLYNNFKPDYIVNCIGVLNKNAENNAAKAILINSYLPHFLAKLSEHDLCRVIHISTDCVFSGKKGKYLENDHTDGQGYYAKSKALGELMNFKDLTLRTSIIGPELTTGGIGLFQWFSSQTGIINGYTNVYWTGVTTIQLAKTLLLCIKEDKSGLYHIVNGMTISKFDLLGKFKNNFPNSEVVSINKDSSIQYDKSLVNTNKDFENQVPDYDTMITEMKEWIESHLSLYPHYRLLLGK